MEEMATYDLPTLKKWFDEYCDAKSDEINEQRKSRQYYHGNQLSDHVRKELKKRKQPPITSNFIRQTIDGVVGLDSRYRQDPKAFPRTPNHAEQSEVATASIRFVTDNNKWSMVSTECLMDGTQSGILIDQFSFEQDTNGQTEIKIERLESEKFFYDPRSIKADFSDAAYMGSWGWFDLFAAIEMFPDKADELQASVSRDANNGSYGEDSQRDWLRNWFDTDRQLVKIVEMWIKRNDQWVYCFFTGAHKLSEGQSPFLDWNGRSGCRFVAQSTYIDESGDRYSLIRDLMPLQDEINQRRSKMLHLINVRQTWARSGMLKSVNQARMELARPDGHLEIEGVFGQDWGIIDQTAQIQGQAALLEASKVEMESFGPGQALLGQGGLTDSSGRALALHLQAGMSKMQPFFNRVRDWKLRNYRMIWANIQRYWDTERYIMVTDDPQDVQHIPVNQLTINEMGQPMMQNRVAEMDMDIIIDESPDTVTLASETFDKLVSLVQAGIQFPPEILLEASDLDTKTKMRVQKMYEQAQQENPMMQQAQQLEIAEKAADVDKTVAETEYKQAQTAKIGAEIGSEIGQMALPI